MIPAQELVHTESKNARQGLEAPRTYFNLIAAFLERRVIRERNS